MELRKVKQMVNIGDTIEKLKLIEDEADELLCQIGLGEDIEEVVNNIIAGNIKKAYITLVNPICEYCIRNKFR